MLLKKRFYLIIYNPKKVGNPYNLIYQMASGRKTEIVSNVNGGFIMKLFNVLTKLLVISFSFVVMLFSYPVNKAIGSKPVSSLPRANCTSW